MVLGPALDEWGLDLLFYAYAGVTVLFVGTAALVPVIIIIIPYFPTIFPFI